MAGSVSMSFSRNRSRKILRKSTLQRRSDLCIPRNETARPISQFPHSCSKIGRPTLGYINRSKILAMSNQRSFKIETFRFAAFVPKKIEYIRFWNKILDRNKMFSISTRKIWSKNFCSAFSKIFFGTNESFVLSLKNPGAIWNVLVSFWYHFLKVQKFCFDSWAAWSKQKRSELVKKFGNSLQKFRFVSSEA